MKKMILVLSLVLLVFMVTAQGAEIMTVNPGFEQPATATRAPAADANALGQWILNTQTNVPFDAGFIASNYGGSGVALTSPEGSQHAYFNVQSTGVAPDYLGRLTMRQELGMSVVGRTYTLDFKYAHAGIDPDFRGTVSVTVFFGTGSGSARLYATSEITGPNMTWATATSAQGSALYPELYGPQYIESGSPKPISVYLVVTNRVANDVTVYLDALNLMVNTDAAQTPSPAHLTSNVPINQTLSWTPGTGAVEHDVYFGTNVDTVNAASVENQLGVYKGRINVNTFTPADLTTATGYAWRIDEVKADSSIIKGSIWTFNTAPYITIDDMSTYDNASNPITNTWIAGANTTVTMAESELTLRPVATLDWKSLKIGYNNALPPYYSQATRTFAVAEDFTAHNTTALLFWVHGIPGNSEQPVYLTLEDSASNKATLISSDVTSIVQELNAGWMESNFALQSFANAGVNTASIKKLTVGVGNPNNPQAGGTGSVHFDVVRRYITRCRSSLIPGDLTGDCYVNLHDVVFLATDWLKEEQSIVPTQPSDEFLVFHYNLNQSSGTTVYDSSTNLFDGEIRGNYSWVSGYTDNGLEFTGEAAGVGTRIKVLQDAYASANVMSKITNQITISLWANGNADRLPANTGAVFHHKKPGTGAAGNNFICYIPYTDGQIYWYAGGATDSQWCQTSGPAEYEGQWNHYAFIKNVATGEMFTYVNGELCMRNTNRILPINGGPDREFSIGGLISDSGLNWPGKMDEFRLYNKALTHGEVLWLADHPPLVQPLVSPGDIDDDGDVDLDDLMFLVDDWAQHILWP